MLQSAGLNQRLDPYKNYKLKLVMNDRVYSGGILTGLQPPPGPAEYRAGNENTTSPRIVKHGNYEPITLNRGVTKDPSFSSWASQVMSKGSSAGWEVSPANFRKSILLEIYNEAGQLVVWYKLNGHHLSETRIRPPAVYQHILHPAGPGTLEEQLAAIFENSLRRSAA